MSRAHRGGRTVALAALLLAAASASQAGTLAGRWRLAEQSREQAGPSVRFEAPIDLECFTPASGAGCRVLVGGPSPLFFDWPALTAEGRPLPLTLQRRVTDARSGRLYARYLIEPASSPGQDLLVEEEYRLTPGGAGLIGTISITLRQAGEEAGTIRRHRRFVRLP